MPIRQGFPLCQSALSASALSAYRLHARPPLPLYAGVEPAHTRICSATSCDVFARVVWIKPWGETDLNFLLCPPPALACHARFLRLSRVCGRSLKEERLPLFVLFVLFGQAKSTWCFFVTFRTSEKYMVLFCYFSDRRKVLFINSCFLYIVTTYTYTFLIV